MKNLILNDSATDNQIHQVKKNSAGLSIKPKWTVQRWLDEGYAEAADGSLEGKADKIINICFRSFAAAFNGKTFHPAEDIDVWMRNGWGFTFNGFAPGDAAKAKWAIDNIVNKSRYGALYIGYLKFGGKTRIGMFENSCWYGHELHVRFIPHAWWTNTQRAFQGVDASKVVVHMRLGTDRNISCIQEFCCYAKCDIHIIYDEDSPSKTIYSNQCAFPCDGFYHELYWPGLCCDMDNAYGCLQHTTATFPQTVRFVVHGGETGYFLKGYGGKKLIPPVQFGGKQGTECFISDVNSIKLSFVNTTGNIDLRHMTNLDNASLKYILDKSGPPKGVANLTLTMLTKYKAYIESPECATSLANFKSKGWSIVYV